MYQTKKVIRIRYRLGDKKELILQTGVKELKQITTRSSRPYTAKKLTIKDVTLRRTKNV